MTSKIYIFGAHSRGKTTAHYLCYLYPELEVEAYLYDNDELNESSVNGCPVIHIDESTKLNTDYPVYIGTRGMFHSAIIAKLEKIGMKDIRPVTVEVDLKLRNAYLKRYYESIGREFIKIDDLAANDLKSCDVLFNVSIYVVKSIFDKQLADSYVLEEYEREIQVGAALTEDRLAKDITVDNVGDNISVLNKQFCELTALYWIWKNTTEDVVGLVHYRRHFTMPGDWGQRMVENKVDAILPVPLYVVPNLEENYRSRHDGFVLDYLFEYILRNHAEDYADMKAFWKDGLYSPCNMIVARKEVLDDLCEWLFPILFAVAEYCGQKKDVYQNRYPGFLSERLISYFFEKNKEKYNLVFADKNFLQ